MGFGFNLFVVFILFPLTIILLIVWGVTRKKVFGGCILAIILGVFGMILLSLIVRFFTEKKPLDKSDIHGAYIIDRTMFPGKQANWQYNHFRFEITEDNKFNFYITEKDKVVRIEKGTISFVEGYFNPRLKIKVAEPHHHIIEEQPTLHSSRSSFYYTFYSPKFGNVFFRKGEWKPLDN